MRNFSDSGAQDWCDQINWEQDLKDLLAEVRALMSDRHKKYGSGNIAKRGLPGILVRLDDKLARLDNGDMDFGDESYRDAWMDVVGYSLIALMCLDGSWPGVEKPA
ncbi:MAG TPA: hypothetical protein VJW23_10160 [Propionibacteriaceae bacterium]|nr:hypothetical protein [Propionibacteriaceae bacterium]